MTKPFGRMALLVVIAGALAVTASVPAHADSKPTPSASASSQQDDSSDSTPRPRPSGAPGNDDGDAKNHQELHDKYGNDVDQVFLPPLIVTTGPSGTPGLPQHVTNGSTTTGISGSNTTSGTATNGSGLQTGDIPLPPSELKNATQINPAANIPLNPDSIVISDQSPADSFFQAATFGLAIMGAGAVALGGLAVAQRIRHRH